MSWNNVMPWRVLEALLWKETALKLCAFHNDISLHEFRERWL